MYTAPQRTAAQHASLVRFVMAGNPLTFELGIYCLRKYSFAQLPPSVANALYKAAGLGVQH